jgi:hypothetical protein
MERTDRSVDDVLAGLPDDMRNDMLAMLEKARDTTEDS